MPRPPYTRFPKDPPLPASQRGELTKAFSAKTATAGSVKISDQTVIVKASGPLSAGTAGATTLAGDVVGPAGANTVAKIQGNTLAPATITTGQTYVLIGGTLTPSSLGGDVAGSLVQNSVQQIQGTPIQARSPADQATLVYSASAGSFVLSVPAGVVLNLWASCS